MHEHLIAKYCRFLEFAELHLVCLFHNILNLSANFFDDSWKISTFAPDKYLIFWFWGVGVVIHLHLFSFAGVGRETRSNKVTEMAILL